MSSVRDSVEKPYASHLLSCMVHDVGEDTQSSEDCAVHPQSEATVKPTANNG